MNVIEPSTGKTVNLDGLTPEEQLYTVALAYVPTPYDGSVPHACLCAGVLTGLGLEKDYPWAPTIIAQYLHLDIGTIWRIYFHAAYPEYENDPDMALAMMREELGLDASGHRQPRKEPT